IVYNAKRCRFRTGSQVGLATHDANNGQTADHMIDAERWFWVAMARQQGADNLEWEGRDYGYNEEERESGARERDTSVRHPAAADAAVPRAHRSHIRRLAG